VNRYTGDETKRPRIDVFRVDPQIEAEQVARVRALRAGRSRSGWEKAIAGIESAARGTDNLVPPIMAAVEAGATVGEIADAMRRVFGEYVAADS
jgi:methylmalonyl-CoA mutase N-terminal domain/subunit